ncbi:hypothetical protein WA026_001718 [Henosepilachna vigintioctopunctata]|uniref:MI domain-containing protein n=1 Tax=Henosepilachna vigintioctopunctata TaxID=420089 RepID=A0AAW1UQR2_9CUCU
MFLRKGQKRKIDETNDSTESKMCKMSTDEVLNRIQQSDQEQSMSDKKQLSNIQNDKIENHSKSENWEETSLGSNEEDVAGSSESEEDVPNKSIKGASKINPDGTWEDIYGRMRSKEGGILNKSEQKYVPRAIRLKMETNEQEKEVEKLNRLKKQLKGLINRLAENNMHNISSQIEQLYMSHSRNDMNETLTNLILESVVSNVICPERLLMGNVLLIVILHANIGTEVGAHFLQTIVSKFSNNLNIEVPVEDKNFDNIVMVLAQLYNFKLFDSKLIYEILYKLSENFNEKNIDCILHCLRTVGFSLRKDDPLALKDLILELQKRAATASQNVITGTRVKFLLDILLAVKNNNMSKIPNYDNSYSEHLKKIMKGFIRKGNYVTQLSISLEDLLKAEERGKWWVVGSAWTGNTTENKETLKKPKSDSFSQKLLELARKQRMNTDTRRNIFCILMSAEDYLDAFEKLLHLGLTKNQNREIIHVILHCCLHENPYNPYYAILTQKFCDYDRKYQLTIKYSIWDKLKALGEQSAKQSSNLAKLLIHLFLEKGLSISILKIVQFSEMDKITLRFVRQILLGILLHENIEECTQVFENVAQSDKLKMFRESIRLFIHHFMLKNINSEQIDEKQSALLQTRAKIIDKLLVMKERSRF